MTAATELRLYTEEFYNNNQTAIDNSSRCGNVAELVTIDNQVYASIKAADYGTSRDIPVNMDEATIQTDLDDLNAGVFESYSMNCGQFQALDGVQLTAGDYYNTWQFIRFEDQWGYRWKIRLYRNNTNALSVSTLHSDGSFWYTTGSFIEVEPGIWEIESWVGEGNHTAPIDQYFEFIEGSAPITQVYKAPADVREFDGKLAYYGE